MDEEKLYPIYRPVEDVDGAVEVRPVVWLMTSDETPHMLMTPDEAASLLSVDRNAVLGLISFGALQSVRIDDEVRVPLCSLGEYVESLEEGSWHDCP